MARAEVQPIPVMGVWGHILSGGQGKPWLRGAGAKFPEAGIPYQYI